MKTTFKIIKDDVLRSIVGGLGSSGKLIPQRFFPETDAELLAFEALYPSGIEVLKTEGGGKVTFLLALYNPDGGANPTGLERFVEISNS